MSQNPKKLHSKIINNPDFLVTLEFNSLVDEVNDLFLKIDLEKNLNNIKKYKIELKTLINDLKIPQEVYTNNITKTVIIGNGDVRNYDDGIDKINKSKADGAMIGRGIFHNPWAFLPTAQSQILDTKKNRIKLLIEHLESWDKTWINVKEAKYKKNFVPNSADNTNFKNFASMKKFVKMYIANFDGALELRTQLMLLNTPSQMIEVLKQNF